MLGQMSVIAAAQEIVDKNNARIADLKAAAEKPAEKAAEKADERCSCKEEEAHQCELRFCPKCGAQVRTDAVYCQACGAKL